MIEKMPGYYRKSKVMTQLCKSIENEFERLKSETTLIENQFFVVLSDRAIKHHEEDVGLVPDTSASIDTRRGRVLSKLRGTGTVTKTMMKNVAKSFINGDIEIIEYPSKYCFAVKFTSKTGVPYNLEDIKSMIEEIKPLIWQWNISLPIGFGKTYLMKYKYGRRQKTIRGNGC